MQIKAYRITRYLATALILAWLLPAAVFAEGPVGEWYMSFVWPGQDDLGPSTPYQWRGPHTLAIVEEDGKYSGTFPKADGVMNPPIFATKTASCRSR